MALVKCKECGNEISKKADKCPHCGAPQKKKTSVITWIFTIIIAFLVYAIIIRPSYTPQQQSSPNLPAVDRSPAKQAERKEFIQKLISTGVLYKVEVPGKYPHVFVAPGFYTLKIDDKNAFINVVYAYYYAQDSNSNIAVLYDSQSGKEIGTYSERGLDLN